MSLYSDTNLLVGGQPALQVHAWQHPQSPGSFTVEVNTADCHGRIASPAPPARSMSCWRAWPRSCWTPPRPPAARTSRRRH